MKFTSEVIGKWHIFYDKLVEFYHQHQHCNVPPDWPDDPELVKWVKLQRRIKGQLPSALKQKLIDIDFDFSDHQYPWQEKFSELQEFAKKTGHVHVPASDPAYAELHHWLLQQVKNKNLLPEQKFRQLDAMGVYWECHDLREWKWQEMYSDLKRFYEKYGHSSVPQKWPGNPQLSNWVLVQRRCFAQNKIPRHRKQKLDDLQFTWTFKNVYNSQWEEKYELLIAFKDKHRHTKVPLTYSDQKLAGWVDRQRTLKSKGKLLPEREKRLNEIGFIWDCTRLQEEQWMERYQQLVAFKKKHGDCLVPVNYKPNRSLGIWVSTQRTLEQKGNMPAQKKQLLEKIGFAWKNEALKLVSQRYERQWQQKYRQLVDYFSQYGTLQVSVQHNRTLQRWTCAQRKMYQDGRLSSKRIKMLEEIGFAWNLHESYWMNQYHRLAEYQKRFGDTRVPWQWKENPNLGQWVSRIRIAGKKDLSAQQIQLLDKIGFDWYVKKKKMVPWQDMYNQLVIFKKHYGHTRVPVNWVGNKKLGKWISRIRSERDRLHPEKKNLLDTINFDWQKRKRGRLKSNEVVAESY